jgi:ribonuclease T2
MPQRFIIGLIVTTIAALVAFPFATKAQKYNRDFGSGGFRQQRAEVPGDFDYYAMVLSWSPTHCASQPSSHKDPQCNPKPGKRPYAFVLHGLWPQYAVGYPDRCWTRFKPYVPKRVINGMLDIMPDTALVIHQYKKHGTCSGLSPEAYFELSSRLFRRIKIPQRYMLPESPQMVAPDTLIDEFIAANSVLGLRHDMIVVSCGGPGNRLREVRICLTRDGDPRPCGRNEDQRRLCDANRMYVPPVRVPAARP